MSFSRRGGRRAAWLLTLALAGTAPSLHAQYFGRNKVQYQNLNWRVLKTTHFDIYYYLGEEVAAHEAGRMSERWFTRLSTVFQHELTGRQPLILYASPTEFQTTNAVGGDLGEGTGGVTEALRRRIVLPSGGTLTDLNHVIGHELTHAFQYDITGNGRSGTLGAAPGATALPLWFIEGMAEYMSLGPIHAPTAMWLRGAIEDTAKDTLPTFRQLDDPRYFPYRYGHALLAYIAGHWGDDAIGRLLRSGARRRAMDPAIREVLGISPDTLVARWHAELHAAYDPLRAQTRPADALGPQIVGARKGTRYNVSPSLSPDGTQMMFLSDRDLFSIDLFLADARTGRIERQVTKTAVDPHLQSLEFIESAGSWSPDGKQFVLSAISAGRPILRIYDVAHGKTVRDIRFPKLGEILNPSWSPDGHLIAFSGLRGGFTDLYTYNLQSGEQLQLTDDAFADLQPAWSPDGRRLAFATDRFSTDLATLHMGPYSLGLLDIASGRITQVAGGKARRFDPQWSPDGASIYFLSDPDGITNVYRVTLADGAVSRVTDLYTGVSGITELSPALSVAQRSGRLIYSVFRANGYEIYAVDNPVAVAQVQPAAYKATDSVAAPPAAILAPIDRPGEKLLTLLNDPLRGLPPDTTFPAQKYRPGLALTYVGQPSLFAGSSQFGTYIGGGASLYFSDILGDHNLITGLQVQGSLKDVYGLVGYQNLAHRLNWTIAAQQTPYLTGAFAETAASVNNEPAVVDQELTQRQINRDIFGQVSYPFSQVQRIEFGAGYTNISFSNELRTQAVSLLTGDVILDHTDDLPAGQALNLGVASAALVYDNSFFGATSPIFGQRYRFEVTPTVGSLNYVGVLGDFRRYVMPVRPFTFATQLLHYGRYGKDGEDPRLQPLFLGYPGLVRGYGFGSFDASECNPPPNDPTACPTFDQLLGSRMVVGKAELRFPLLGVLGAGSGYYGAFPVELAFFGDGGLAWDSAHQPSIFGSGTRDPVFSAGAALRINLLGFAVAELDMAHPFDRPGKGIVWEFNLQPGF